MKNGIVGDGLGRLMRGQKKLTLESFEKKYAKELATAQPHQKAKVYQQIMEEYDRQKNHKPSVTALW